MIFPFGTINAGFYWKFFIRFLSNMKYISLFGWFYRYLFMRIKNVRNRRDKMMEVILTGISLAFSLLRKTGG